ncbi:hypothetical protein [Rhizobium phaseoli]|uniref:hypothetical protein n=1 Tax=Rhizobium phaseoli TaxID=396 RepID=UPI00123738B2|nr:hypothetical protein [Rhizobium phaseoli]
MTGLFISPLFEITCLKAEPGLATGGRALCVGTFDDPLLENAIPGSQTDIACYAAALSFNCAS